MSAYIPAAIKGAVRERFGQSVRLLPNRRGTDCYAI